MLTPAQRVLTLYPGFQFDPLFQFWSDLACTQPFDVTGYSGQLVIGSGILVLSSTGPGLVFAGSSVQAFATAQQTAALTPQMSPLRWFLTWTAPGGEPDCPVAGTLQVSAP